jgi:hypothetical protein
MVLALEGLHKAGILYRCARATRTHSQTHTHADARTHMRTRVGSSGTSSLKTFSSTPKVCLSLPLALARPVGHTRLTHVGAGRPRSRGTYRLWPEQAVPERRPAADPLLLWHARLSRSRDLEGRGLWRGSGLVVTRRRRLRDAHRHSTHTYAYIYIYTQAHTHSHTRTHTYTHTCAVCSDHAPRRGCTAAVLS